VRTQESTKFREVAVQPLVVNKEDATGKTQDILPARRTLGIVIEGYLIEPRNYLENESDSIRYKIVLIGSLFK
jgi:hypothetical protein